MIKIIGLPLFALVLTLNTQAQTSKSKTSTKSSTTKKATPAPVKKDVTVTLKSMCEKNVMIYAGDKAGIRNPNPKPIGGLSKNTLYLKTYDVVCILKEGNKVAACAEIKPGNTYVEINSSGTAISVK
jgi:hypothetical protein